MDTVNARPFSISDGSWTVQPGCQFFYNSATNKTFIIHGRDLNSQMHKRRRPTRMHSIYSYT